MTEKFKIYIPEDVKNRLATDAELFEFIKPDGSINLNAFLKELIINFFDAYREREDALLHRILADLDAMPSVSKDDATAIADRILNTYMRETHESAKNSATITLTVSGKALAIIRAIENNFLAEKSLSQYMKEMFLSYLSISRGDRERIIFKDTCEELLLTIKKHVCITFSTSTSVKEAVFEMQPYMLVPSKEEQCNYLLCFDAEKGHARSFRISRIRDLFSTTKSFEQDEEILQEIREAARRNPQSASKAVDAKVRMTDRGKKMFTMITKGRPEILKKDGNFYYFNWPPLQLEEYFKRFGKEAVVLEPERSHEIIETFYERGLEAYRKYPRRR